MAPIRTSKAAALVLPGAPSSSSAGQGHAGSPPNAAVLSSSPYSRSPPVVAYSTRHGASSPTSSLSSSPIDAAHPHGQNHLAARKSTAAMFLPSRTGQTNRGGTRERPLSQQSTAELTAGASQRRTLLASIGTNLLTPDIISRLEREATLREQLVAQRTAVADLEARMTDTALDPAARDERKLMAGMNGMSLLRSASSETKEAKAIALPNGRHKQVTLKTLSDAEADQIQRQVWESEQEEIRTDQQRIAAALVKLSDEDDEEFFPTWDTDDLLDLDG